MKKILMLLLVICCCGCSHEETIKHSKPCYTTIGQFIYVQYDGHEYLIWNNGMYQNGITHSPNCPCKNKQDYDGSGID